jgi:NitT/TauT family transport system substrate-binding protein
LNFYNLKGSFSGITGEDIYNKMSVKYAKVGYPSANIPSWRLVGNSSIISEINLAGSQHMAEEEVKFSAPAQEKSNAVAISTKRVSIAFRSGSAEIDENAKYIIDNEFLDIAKSFANSRIRIEGNTDNTGSAAANKTLSYNRAKSVADYLIKEHKFDQNRFVIVGNGPDKPVADNNTDDGKAKNRRTDFELLAE